MSPFLFSSTVLIESTNKCNLGCEFCEANCTVNKGLPTREISPDELRLMLEKIKPLIANIVFQGDCEPTMNRRLPELVGVASEYSSSVAMVTNGTLLTEDYTRKLLARGLKWFAFSIDDDRREVFNKIRVNADLDRVVKNLRRLVTLRDTEDPSLHLVVHKIIFPTDTLESLKRFVRFFYLELGVNQLTFAPLVVEGDIKCRNWLTLRNQLESELLAEGVYINLREFGNYPYKTVHKYCGTNLLFISHQGDLSPCGLHVRHGRTFGNLLRESMEEIAQRKPFQEFHTFWQRKDYNQPLPSHCQDCFLLKGHYHRYTLNEGHARGLQFLNHPGLRTPDTAPTPEAATR